MSYMKLRNTEFFGVCFMKEVGKWTKEEGVNTCVKHSTMKEDIGTNENKYDHVSPRI